MPLRTLGGLVVVTQGTQMLPLARISTPGVSVSMMVLALIPGVSPTVNKPNLKKLTLDTP